MEFKRPSLDIYLAHTDKNNFDSSNIIYLNFVMICLDHLNVFL